MEIEIKLRLEQPEALRERLRRLGAEPLGTVRERNWILDAADASLRGRGCALRVRSEQAEGTGGDRRVTLTYKGPRQPDASAPTVSSRSVLGEGKAPSLPHAGDKAEPCSTPNPETQPRRTAGLKIREEIETVATDEPALRTILSRLGFRPMLCYEKRRETWKLAGCLVTLDELPKLGWFAEIEGPDVAAVRNAQTLAGIDSASPIAESYAEMTRLHGVVMDDGSRALRFAE